MKRSLTDLEAYKAMFCFLEKYYNQTGSDDVGSLLGSMQILEDKSTADPAMCDDSKDCIEKTKTLLEGE